MKFSIITPSYNNDKYISQTIDSVLSQEGDFEIEYIIMDGGSTDNTVNILKKYEEKISMCFESRHITFKWFSEKDNGMYDAINKGFSLATGDIYAWINADDIYLPGAFNVVEKGFKTYPQIKWLKGITSYINEFSTIFELGKCYLYNQDWIKQGIYGKEIYFIQQDSVFWSSDLWKKVGKIDTTFKLAGDYYLWTHFSVNSPLYTIKAYLSCFRKHTNQLSHNIEAYKKECEKISPHVPELLSKKIKYFFMIESKIPVIYLRHLLYYILFGNQELFLIELIDGNKPVLKKVSYYQVDSEK